MQSQQNTGQSNQQPGSQMPVPPLVIYQTVAEPNMQQSGQGQWLQQGQLYPAGYTQSQPAYGMPLQPQAIYITPPPTMIIPPAPQPPQTLTDKDLLMLVDLMSLQLSAIKKCYHFGQESTDPQIRTALDRAGQMHQRHFNLLLQHCQYNGMQANMLQ